MGDIKKETIVDDVKDEEVKVNNDQAEDNRGIGDTQESTEEIRKELEEEYQKKLQSEVDKRVTEAVKKTEKRVRAEIEEQKRLEQLTEEERRQEEEQKRQRELEEKEKNLIVKELKLELIDILAEQGLDVKFKDFIDVSTVLNEENKRDILVERVETLKAIFDEVVDKKVAEIKKEYLKGDTPNALGENNKPSPIDEYEEAKKRGDVRAMLKYDLMKLRE